MLGMFRTTEEVGIYNVALRVSMITGITLMAINTIATPKFAEFWGKVDMSVVGPRPYIKEEFKHYNVDEETINKLLSVKLGIPGLWQVSGRNDIDYEKRVKLDTFYVINWSL